MKKFILCFLINIAIFSSLSAQEIAAIYYDESQDLVAWATPDSVYTKITFANLKGDIICEIPFMAKFASIRLERIQTLYVKDRGLFVLAHEYDTRTDWGETQYTAGISIFDVKNAKLLMEKYPQPGRPSASFFSLRIYPDRNLLSVMVNHTRAEDGIHIMNYLTGEVTLLYYCKFIVSFDDGILYKRNNNEYEGLNFYYDFDEKVMFKKIKIRSSLQAGIGMVIDGQDYVLETSYYTTRKPYKLYQWDRKKGLFTEVDKAIADGIPVLEFKTKGGYGNYFEKNTETQQEKTNILNLANTIQIASILNSPAEINSIKEQGEIASINFLLSWESKLVSSEQGEALLQRLSDVFGPSNPIEIEYLIGKSSSLKKFYYKSYIEWLKATPVQTLAADGLAINKSRVAYIEDYHSLVSSNKITQEYLVDEKIYDAVKLKIQPLSYEFYYFDDATLLAKAEQELVIAKMTGKGAAIMAAPYYLELAKRHPKDAMMQVKLGDTYLQAGHYYTANQYYLKALELKPNDVTALYGQLMCLVTPFKNAEIGVDDKLCNEVITAANKLNNAGADYLAEKTNAQIASAIFKLYLSDKETYEAYTVAQKTTGAQARIAAFESVLPMLKAPNNAMLLASTKSILAYEYLMLGGDASTITKADELLKEAIAGGVELPGVYNMRCLIYDQRLGKPDVAWTIVKAGRLKFPKDKELLKLDGEFLYGVAKTQFNSKSYSQAISTLEQYMKTREQPAIEGLVMLGYAYLQTKNNTKALANLSAAKYRFYNEKDILAYYPNFNFVLEYAKSPSGDVPVLFDNIAAIDAMHKKMEQVAGNTDNTFTIKKDILMDIYEQSKEMGYVTGMSLANRNLGILYFKRNEFRNAEIHFKQSVETTPTDVRNYIDLSRTYMKQKKYSDATYLLDKAAKQFPDHVEIRMEYANVYADWGYEEETKKIPYSAMSKFKKSLSYDDYNAGIHMALGIVYYSVNKNDKDAVVQIKRALELDPALETKFPVLREILKGTFGSSSSTSKAADTKNYCYTAIMKKDEGTTTVRTLYAAIFIQITAPEGASESAIKSFGKGKANMQTRGYQIFKETMDLDKQCTDCKQVLGASYKLADFVILHETMR